MKKVGFLLFIIHGLNLYCQDSIHFNTNEIIVAKVTEININEVLYHRYDNISGPVYHIDKDKIHFIKYENGMIDTFKVSKKQLYINSPSSDDLSMFNSKFKISIVKNHLEYKSLVLNKKGLFILINTYDNAEKKALLLRDLKLMNRYKYIDRITFPLGLGFGLAAIALTGLYTLSEVIYGHPVSNMEYVYAGLGTGALILGTTIPISIIHKKKFLKKREDMVQLYNTL